MSLIIDDITESDEQGKVYITASGAEYAAKELLDTRIDEYTIGEPLVNLEMGTVELEIDLDLIADELASQVIDIQAKYGDPLFEGGIMVEDTYLSGDIIEVTVSEIKSW